jgi:indolepyruvate ferredoxin oxidoreductase beta subunit
MWLENNDPFNLIVCGVGGQGNVLASQLIGAALVSKGFKVTIGETYGASQRGGSVMSHVRISQRRQYGPIMPPSAAHLIIALEPVEAARILGVYGAPETVGLVNLRPVQPVDVISGLIPYPDLEKLRQKIERLCRKAIFVNATETALEMGNPILTNVILLGAAAAHGLLPITGEDLGDAVSMYISPEKAPINIKAFNAGQSLAGS